MGESPSVARVHVVVGRPWKDALIKVLAPGCPYRPWSYGEDVEPGDGVILVLDTEPVSVLAGVGVVGDDGNVDHALMGIELHRQQNTLLDVGTLEALTDFRIRAQPGVVYSYQHDSPDALVELINTYNLAERDAFLGHSSMVAGRVLMASNGRCSGCHAELDLLGDDARDRVHVHTADSRWSSPGQQSHGDSSDWPAALCSDCFGGMQRANLSSFVDFQFSRHPQCPFCSARRTRTTMYGMPSGPVEEPWIAAMGCCVEPWEWLCDACGYQW
jgi:hypothetical protein